MVTPIQDFQHDIQPGVGLGPLRLGSTQDQVLSLLGEPTTREYSEPGRPTPFHDWEYAELGLDLHFSADDDYRLGTISTESTSAKLNWQYPVGMTEDELLRCDFGGLGPPRPNDDFAELGKDFAWDKQSLTCWVREGVVDSISMFPFYDETDMVPQWPAQ